MLSPDFDPSESGITAATKTARRVVLAAFAASAILVGGLTAERWSFYRASSSAVADVKNAHRLADAVLLEDERLTMSAQLAAATGEPRWAERYEAHIPAIDKAIAEATAMAPPGAAERFDQATRVANDRLVAMERQALAQVQQGQLVAAQAVLNSADYAAQKQILAAGSDAFMAELQAAVDSRLAGINARSWAFVAAALLLFALGSFWLWAHLRGHLGRAEAAFAEKQREVTRLALHDPLTGLSNRRYLQMQMAAALARAERERAKLAVLVMDLDGFKPINDRLGHAAGDMVLMETARRLVEHSRRSEIVARLGGDEFVVVLDGCDSAETAARAAQRVAASLSEPVALPEGSVVVGACVGVALYPADGAEVEELIRKADLALYRAKAAGRGEVRFFQDSMDQELREREGLREDLRQAIASGQVVPHFQPLIDLASGQLTGFEVLARWTHPDRGPIPPARFVPIAEDSGQIDALTVCVMRAALQAARGWDPKLTIAVNIAPQQLRHEALIERLLGVLAEADFPPERFEIEITENALIADLDLARHIVQRLKEHGVRVALDDFGTGYSSLSHLSELPFDKIKIDRSFIRTMIERPESASIVNAIIGLGRSLKLQTTAEGVESAAEADWLARSGCVLGQGFHYARPMPAHEAAELVRAMESAGSAGSAGSEDSAPAAQLLSRAGEDQVNA
jgi:diguanylate cyclase (GGDEF)-like protein